MMLIIYLLCPNNYNGVILFSNKRVVNISTSSFDVAFVLYIREIYHNRYIKLIETSSLYLSIYNNI